MPGGKSNDTKSSWRHIQGQSTDHSAKYQTTRMWKNRPLHHKVVMGVRKNRTVAVNGEPLSRTCSNEGNYRKRVIQMLGTYSAMME